MSKAIPYTATITITPLQIADIMVTAFEGGINYWCKRVAPLVIGTRTAEHLAQRMPWYDDDAVWSRPFTLHFYDAESDDTWRLDQPKLREGLQRLSPRLLTDLTTGEADADAADQIVQTILFGETVFG